MKTVKIAIDRHGNINIDVLGTQGTQCEEIVAALLKELGDVETEMRKDSYYHQEHIRRRQQTDIDTGWKGG
jgi:hypothetical protein